MSKKRTSSKTKGIIASETAAHLEQSQISRYHTKPGHGFVAEDANAFSDKMRLKTVEQVGKNHELNGADRIVNGVSIQTKYCQSALKTIDSAFTKENGLYRYGSQLLEVPKDQYQNCIELMKGKIVRGKVPGITDPSEAENLVKEGSVTYRQAVNIAKSGNIDSIVFDVKTRSVTSAYIFSISFAVHYAQYKWDGNTHKDATKYALYSAIADGSTSLITGVITAQVIRTRAAAGGVVFFRNSIKSVYSTSAGKVAIEKIASASLGKSVYGVAARNHVAKLLRSNVATCAIVTGVTATPDLYRAALSKSISWPQMTKNLIVNASGIAAGAVGWMGGAAAGAALGSVVPGVGNAVGAFVGGLCGSLGLCTLGTMGSKKLADLIVEDDAKKMVRIVQAVSEELAFDYLLSENEIQAFCQSIERLLNPKWFRAMYKAGTGTLAGEARREFATKALADICESIISTRPRIFLPGVQEVNTEIDAIISSVGLEGVEQ